MSRYTKPKIIQGDFFEEYNQHLRAKSVDLFLADPPYGLFSDNKDVTGVDDPEINLDKLETALDHLVTKTGQVILFCDLDLMIKLKQQFTKFEFRFNYVAYKNNGSPTHKTRPLNNIEYIAVFQRKDVKATDLTFNPKESGRVGNPYRKRNYNRDHSTRDIKKREVDINESGKRHIKQSLEMKSKCCLTDTEKTGHPFQKPERLLRILIKVHSNKNALICDGFAGSGSTLVSANKENRRSIGFESDKKWYKVAKDRIQQETSKLNLFSSEVKK